MLFTKHKHPLQPLHIHIREFRIGMVSGGSRISYRGPNLVRGGADSQGGTLHFENLYVNAKESGPLGGGHASAAPPWIRQWWGHDASWIHQCSPGSMLYSGAGTDVHKNKKWYKKVWESKRKEREKADNTYVNCFFFFLNIAKSTG